MTHSVVTNGPDETRSLGERIGRLVTPGDVVALVGDLGSGKTTFAQGLAVGLDIPADVVVNSPTFTILAEHREGRIPLYHFDVYRLAGSDDLHDLAFDEYLDDSGVVLIEWADRIPEALPRDVLLITMVEGADESVRIIQLAAYGPGSLAIVNSIGGTAA